jgi:hypothetical protein
MATTAVNNPVIENEEGAAAPNVKDGSSSDASEPVKSGIGAKISGFLESKNGWYSHDINAALC